MDIQALICDFDDTLVESYVEFLRAEQQFLQAMAELDLPHDQAVVDYLRAADIAHVEQRGYMHPDCFPRALALTYRHYAALAGQSPDPAIAERLEQIGWRIFQRPPRLVEGALNLLQTLQGRTRLFLLTQGDEQVQRQRVEASGLPVYFEQCRIIRSKDEAAYRRLIAEWGLIPSRCWMLGNSLKADIAPALAVGLNAAFFQRQAWSYEHDEPRGAYHVVSSLAEFLELIEA